MVPALGTLWSGPEWREECKKSVVEDWMDGDVVDEERELEQKVTLYLKRQRRMEEKVRLKQIRKR